jgi:GWxTD domain-containing protein
MPVYTTDLDDAINQLRYIAKGGDIRKMKKAKGEEKQRMFNEFWLAMDPTPGTDQNELMEEYYRRVDFSNSNFRGLRDGWLTDRGMVYIILGPPDNIERYPFEANSKPYEIWSFYRLNRDFIFVDETGFGDYRLVTPFWEILERLQ